MTLAMNLARPGVICFLFVFCLAAPALAQTESEELTESRLSITIHGGEVQIEATPDAMGAREQEMIRSYFSSQTGDSPFEGNVRVQFILREPVLGQLRQRLEKVEVQEQGQEEIEEAISEALSIAYSNQERKGVEAEEKVFVGSHFLISGEESYSRVVAVGSKGSIGGEVDELILIGSEVELKPTARVKNAIVSVGSDLKSDPQAQTSKQQITIGLPNIDWPVDGPWETLPSLMDPDSWQSFTPWATLVTFISAMILGLLYLVFFPDFEMATREQISFHLGASLGWGFIGLLGSVAGAIALTITIVGLLMLPFLGVFMMIMISIGYFSMATYIGSRIIDPATTRPYTSFLLGLFILKIVELIPWVGGGVVFFLTVAGFGAALVMLWRSRRRGRYLVPNAEAPC